VLHPASSPPWIAPDLPSFSLGLEWGPASFAIGISQDQGLRHIGFSRGWCRALSMAIGLGITPQLVLELKNQRERNTSGNQACFHCSTGIVNIIAPHNRSLSTPKPSRQKPSRMARGGAFYAKSTYVKHLPKSVGEMAFLHQNSSCLINPHTWNCFK